ncbi:g12127 [Coccomyxa viridis]|uniref:G12127 protein n=1 Tax=Coccomyxa viridis TaxID=1274662 RepID=A0ABP1GAQ2_9CHLO
MALPSPSELDALRAAITALRPEIPGLAARFTDDHLRLLHKNYITDVMSLKCLNDQDLRGTGLPIGLAALLRPGPKEVATTNTSTRVDLSESRFVAIRTRLKSAREATSYIDVSEVGCSLPSMPTIQAEALARDLLPQPTTKQWAAFFEKAGMPGQPDSTNWVKPLSQKELEARQNRKMHGSLDYASTAPSGTFKAPGESVQLAVGWILRALESANVTRLSWRDTSRCGITNSTHKPTFAGFVEPAQVLTCVGVIVVVEDALRLTSQLDQALGRIFVAMEELFSAQPNRRRAFAVAVGMDSVDIVVASKTEYGVVTYQHGGKQELCLNRESLGLQLLVAAFTSSIEASGYETMAPPPHKPVSCEYVGQAVPLKYVDSDHVAGAYSTQVYQVNIRKHKNNFAFEPAILKISPSPVIRTEVLNLRRLSGRRLDDNCTKVVESGEVSENWSYLLLQPVGKQLSQDESIEMLVKLGRGLAQIVAMWHQKELIHRDLSASNVGLAPEGTALVWDFYTMTNVPLGSEESCPYIGDPLYMAISVQQGAAPTLSSELESIFYILLGHSSEDGVMHWQRSPWRETDSKFAAMLNNDTFRKKVLWRTRAELLPLVEALHNLFFPPASNSEGATGRLYSTNVSLEDFLRALASCQGHPGGQLMAIDSSAALK